jgi:type II secretory pathway pseudopilin PulG
MRKRNKGLGLVELIVSLGIAGMLLTAVAAAYSATTTAIEMNDQFFRASQAARVTINQIMAEVRKCQSGVVDDPALELTTALGQKRLYSFNSDAKRITMTLPDELSAPTYTLARNVDSAVFYTDGATIAMRVTVKIGSNQITLSGSAMPRRTMTFD